jgi:hypothetical protein
MTNLSPAAQAVLNAAINVAESPDAEAIAAAVLRAAAYRITPAVPEITSCCLLREQKIRHLLLTIANELEDDG